MTEPNSRRARKASRSSLGRYVVLKARADGTHRVLFIVPPTLRPTGWPATIPLPLDGPYVGDLSDADEVGRIRTDAMKLYRDLTKGRGRHPQVSVWKPNFAREPTLPGERVYELAIKIIVRIDAAGQVTAQATTEGAQPRALTALRGRASRG